MDDIELNRVHALMDVIRIEHFAPPPRSADEAERHAARLAEARRRAREAGLLLPDAE